MTESDPADLQEQLAALAGGPGRPLPPGAAEADPAELAEQLRDSTPSQDLGNDDLYQLPWDASEGDALEQARGDEFDDDEVREPD